ncbi:MAG: response regulator [bacterium]|nr:response regulator [bacterium]
MLKLMIVDDEEIIRNALSHMIDYPTIGYELIATAKNGMEAYDILRDEYPDVIITDIRMPILNGLELIERAKNIDPSIDFILLSGYGEFEYAKQAMQFGVRYYLLKPTDKQELIQSLVQLQKERSEKRQLLAEQRHAFLNQVTFPLEKSFVIEALQHEDLSETWQKYHALLNLPETLQTACFCSFVEESFLANFLNDCLQELEQLGLHLQFPAIYVKNTLVLIFPVDTLQTQERLAKCFSAFSYPQQSVEPDIRFLHTSDSKRLFETILYKISRYSRILLLDESQQSHEIRNHLSAPWKIEKLGEALCNTGSDAELTALLTATFSQPSLDLETARSLALSTYLWLHQRENSISLDFACDFFRKIYSCDTIQDIYEQLRVVYVHRHSDTDAASSCKDSSHVALIKSYVDQHLDEENLSLKWLAENYLFVSPRYLSKQFIQEEGERFSDYLNRQRMEKAKQLLEFYHNDNVKDVAKLVGFGNNPRYFGQVFKKYTGLTPSDYLAKG